ncbi:MAG: LytR/AlgR family response regulator transcription factor [Bacilli bacterium]
MINYILYEDNDCSIKKYSSIINDFMMNKKENYKIIKISKYDNNTWSKIKNIDTKKIYLLDIEVPGKSGIEFAREIRLSGDWMSPIIICSSHEEFKMTGYTSKILTLDFIVKNKDIDKNILDALSVAFDIISTHKSFNFKYSGEYYQIPYQSILYIEKNINDNYSTLHTKRNKYIIKDTINNIFNSLDDERFFQSHRSCIINLDNISSIDFSNNTIFFFGNISTELLSRESKRELKNMINM